jgi:probable phosphoglycerate mutase
MTQATRLVLVRHGETDWNCAGRIQGHTDIALNETGRRQAARMALALQGAELDAIVSSDLARARCTAEALAAVTGLPVALDRALRERSFGRFEGHSIAEIQASHPEEARRWQSRDPHYAPPGGESILQFHARVIQAMHGLVARHAGSHLAVVAHGGVLDAIYRAAMQLPPEAPRQWAIDNASIHRLLATNQGFTVLHWGETSHLDGPALDDTPLGATRSTGPTGTSI